MASPVSEAKSDLSSGTFSWDSAEVKHVFSKGLRRLRGKTTNYGNARAS